MGKGPRIVVGALNIAVSPHPAGVYEQLIEFSAERSVSLAGSDWAKITRAERRNGNVLFGRILVWTEIDKDSSWLNTSKNIEATEDEKDKIEIPPDIKPNFKGFYFAFGIDNHILLIEFRNELNQRFGPRRAHRFFSTLFEMAASEHNLGDVEVTTIPDDDSVDRILGMFSLRTLKIVLLKPNPDVNIAAVNRVLDKLTQNKAKKQIVEFVKEPKALTLTPDEETRTLAIVASTNGYVEGTGRGIDGNQLAESTKEHPKRIDYAVNADQSSEVQFLSRLSDF